MSITIIANNWWELAEHLYSVGFRIKFRVECGKSIVTATKGVA